MKSNTPILLAAGALCCGTSQAATIIAADVTLGLSANGETLFVDDAAAGGGDSENDGPGTATFTETFVLPFSGAATITITGVGYHTPGGSARQDAESVNFAFTYLGADGVPGGGDDVVIGNETVMMVTNDLTGEALGGAGQRYVIFDSLLSASIDGLGDQFAVEVTPSASALPGGSGAGTITFKQGGGTPKFSVAGSYVPEPSVALLGGVGLLGLLRRRR